MTTNQTIGFKDPLWMTAWLDTALCKEKDKYKKCPTKPDLVPGHEVAQAWGYVIAGYFLVEESFKALLYLRGKKVPTKHSLTMLFNLFESDDKEILREYYTDYRETGGWPKKFPIEILDEFLVNLDGDPNKRGDDHIGSFDWRYFLIEEQRSAIMPMVSVEFLHEIAYGCTRMVEHVHKGRFEPSRHTHSWRMRWKRDLKRWDWLTVRMNSDGWDNLPDRLEIVWGPDYKGRHDLLLFKGKGAQGYFSTIPEPEEFLLPIIDKRPEFESFDVDGGFRSIGITRVSRPSVND